MGVKSRECDAFLLLSTLLSISGAATLKLTQVYIDRYIEARYLKDGLLAGAALRIVREGAYTPSHPTYIYTYTRTNTMGDTIYIGSTDDLI